MDYLTIPNITFYYLLDKDIDLTNIDSENIDIPDILCYYLLGNFVINEYLEKSLHWSKNIDNLKLIIGWFIINNL